MENNKRIGGLKVSVTSAPESKVSKTGKNFLSFKAVHEKDDGEKVWLNCLAFGLIGSSLKSHLAKGRRCMLSGTLKTKEYQKKDGGVGIDNTLFVNEAKVADGDKLVTIDEFTTENAPF
jgi:single-stranded DNA-binding protein